MAGARDDRWLEGDAYDRYMGRWSRPVATAFLDWLGTERNLTWLDVGCGTGALTAAIAEATAPAAVVGCDPSSAFIDAARAHHAGPALSFVVAGADELPEGEGGFDRVVSGLVLNFLPDPTAALALMGTRAAPGGSVAAYVWDYAEGMGFLRAFWDEATRLEPAARAHDEGLRFPICRPDALEIAFEEAGLDEVTVDAIEVATTFGSIDELWAPFLEGTGPAPSYVVSLDDGAREALRAALRDRLAPSGGPIELTARAWAARGRAR